MNVLFVSQMSATFMPPLQLSERQINAGWQWPDATEDGRTVSMTLPKGRYRLAEHIARLPAAERPDLTVVLADCAPVCRPDLSGVGGRKLLLVADTHHGSAPLTDLVAYARQEPFDAVALIHDPHHLHWFAEAGIRPLAFIPNVSVRHFGVSRRTSEPHIVFVGNRTGSHVRREHLLKFMAAAGLPVMVASLGADQAAQEYADARICFNCSLNGDLNMRFFEVLAAGGCLLTDRLPPQSSVASMFNEGEDYVAYSSEAELIAQARRLIADPDTCARIARNGHARYLAHHGPDIRRREVVDFAFHGQAQSYVADARLKSAAGFGGNLAERMRGYEIIQQAAQARPATRIAVSASLGARAASDLVDLPGTSVQLIGKRGQIDELLPELDALGVSGQVEVAQQDTPRDVLVLHKSDDAGAIAAGQGAARLVILHGGKGAPLPLTTKSLASLGYRRIEQQPAVFAR